MVATITLPADIATTVRKMVDHGDFADTDAVLREAVHLLQDHLEEQRFLASIEDARRSRTEGRSLPWNGEYEARLWERAQSLAGTDFEAAPEVWPE